MKAEVVPVPGAAGHVRVRFSNDTHGVQWLARPRALLGVRPQSGFLEFDPPSAYVWRRAKRGPYTPDELVAVEPGATVESDDFALSDYYRVPEVAEVRVRYRCGHPLVGMARAGGPFDEVASDWITVRLPAGATT